MQFDPAVLAADPGPRADLLAALEGALAAADPHVAVRRHLARRGGDLLVGEHRLVLEGRVLVLAVGKAAVAMAEAALEVLAGRPIAGAVVAPGLARPVGPLEGWAGGHPLPDAGSYRAGRRLLALARDAGPGDLVLALISGGGSALAEVPAPGLEQADLLEAGRALLAAGVPIAETNTVRRHLSALKGGRLAEAAFPARVATFVISDVAGNALEAIAGGPTVPDPTTCADAMAVITRHGLRLPGAERFLAAAVAGRGPETAKGGPAFAGPVVVVADGPTAAEGAAAAARCRGLRATARPRPVEGQARAAGRMLAAAAKGLAPGEIAVFWGETTVAVTGPGRGGRNQEVALAAGLALEGETGVLVASCGTDGVDGPTDAAGGIGDGLTVERGRVHGLAAAAALAANDSYPYLAACGDLLRCGPTGTNVGDVMVAYRAKA